MAAAPAVAMFLAARGLAGRVQGSQIAGRRHPSAACRRSLVNKAAAGTRDRRCLPRYRPSITGWKTGRVRDPVAESVYTPARLECASEFPPSRRSRHQLR